MTHESTPTTHHSFFERFLRALILGVLAMLGLYLKVLGGILKIGMRAIRKAPLGAASDRT